MFSNFGGFPSFLALKVFAYFSSTLNLFVLVSAKVFLNNLNSKLKGWNFNLRINLSHTGELV